jgi:hypothetical protein
MERVVEYIQQGSLSQYADRAFLDELIAWLRFTKDDIAGHSIGLSEPVD